MKLPQIQYSGVESFARQDVGAEARQAMGKAQVLETAVGEVGRVAQHFDLLRDQKQARTQANQDIAITDQLKQVTSQARININDPFISDDVRSKVISDITADGSALTYTNDESGYWVDSDKVNDYLAESKFKEIQGKQEGLDTRRTRLYGEYAQSSIRKNIDGITANINSANVAAGQREFVTQYQRLIDAGDIEDARAVLNTGLDLGYFDREQVEKINAEGNVVALSRADVVLDDLLSKTGAFKREGNEAAVEANTAIYNQELKQLQAAGLLDAEAVNERVLKWDQSLERQEMAGELNRAYDNGGYEGAQAFLKKHRNTPTKSFGMEDWDKEMISLRQELNRRDADDQKIIARSEKAAQIKVDQSYFTAVSQGAAGVVSGRSAEKVMDTAYEQASMQWFAQGGFQGWRDNVIQMVGNGKYAPKGLVNQLNAMVMSAKANNPESLAQAGEMYNLLGDIDSKLLADIPAGDSKTKMAYAATMQPNVNDPLRIYETVTDLMDNNTVEVRSRRNQEYAGHGSKLDKRYTSMLEDNWGPSWYEFLTKNPSGSAQIKNSYMGLERMYFEKTGDLEFAQGQATKDLAGGWGVDYINDSDGQVMRMPPSMQGEWVKPQFEEYVKKDHAGLVEKYGAEAIGISDEPYRLDQDGQPVYAVVYQPDKENPYYRPPVVDAKKRLVDWKPDYNKTPKAIEQAEYEAMKFGSEESINEFASNIRMQLEKNQSVGLIERLAYEKRIVNDALDKVMDTNPVFAPLGKFGIDKAKTTYKASLDKLYKHYQEVAEKTKQQITAQQKAKYTRAIGAVDFYGEGPE